MSVDSSTSKRVLDQVVGRPWRLGVWSCPASSTSLKHPLLPT